MLLRSHSTCPHPSAPELGQLLLSKYVSRSRNAIYMEKFKINVNEGSIKHMYENMFRLAIRVKRLHVSTATFRFFAGKRLQNF